MTSSERSPEPQDEPRKPRSEAQPLYIRIYFRKHMTDVVRAFGYDELPKAEARSRVQPLIDTYGEADIRAACEEIVEANADGTAWRLTEQARKLAIGILGRPKPPAVKAPDATAGKPADASPAQNDSPASPEVATPTKRAPRKRKPKKEAD
jgi:hypothetical protein